MASSTITVNGANASLPVQLEPGVANRLDVTVDAALRLDANKTNERGVVFVIRLETRILYCSRPFCLLNQQLLNC